MTYYKDLTPYSYYHMGIDDNTLNIGWLDKRHTFTTGGVEAQVIDKLWRFLKPKLLRTRGFHVCEFCKFPVDGPLSVERNNEVIRLGMGEIRIFGDNEQIYAAPDMIYHYIADHNYKPPEEFLEAILTSPLPGSKTYIEKFQHLM
jgi:hypothetical protein